MRARRFKPIGVSRAKRLIDRSRTDCARPDCARPDCAEPDGAAPDGAGPGPACTAGPGSAGAVRGRVTGKEYVEPHTLSVTRTA
ncbi:hypothetical protein Apa02nite_051790 [Actinoplanes palleronii]|uniref:Uncharacterized protein n=1 Tax=Actinoplanes palleronii TaxID=113570 RepID=A0ABQ4BFG5_9ACTN|nr:hypothetical protein Apa02nite_051790 [Actinoplanes palleronii]